MNLLVSTAMSHHSLVHPYVVKQSEGVIETYETGQEYMAEYKAEGNSYIKRFEQRGL